LSPNFIDYHLNFSKESFLNLANIKPEAGGVTPLLSVFKNLHWLKPSELNNSITDDDVKAYFIDAGDGVKRTIVNYNPFELPIDIDFAHVMYGDYFYFLTSPRTKLSVDFAGIASLEHINNILSLKSVKYVFCSEHDAWADDNYLNNQSKNRVIIWHSPKLVRIYLNQSLYVLQNDSFIETNKIVIGAGDTLAVSIMLDLYDKNFEELTQKIIVETVAKAIKFVSKRYFL
jgi:hypothetical protein